MQREGRHDVEILRRHSVGRARFFRPWFNTARFVMPTVSFLKQHLSVRTLATQTTGFHVVNGPTTIRRPARLTFCGSGWIHTVQAVGGLLEPRLKHRVPHAALQLRQRIVGLQDKAFRCAFLIRCLLSMSRRENTCRWCNRCSDAGSPTHEQEPPRLNHVLVHRNLGRQGVHFPRTR